MEITDSFRVSTPIDQTWNVLLDLERIAPCMPGAQLQEVEGDEYRGIVKVKVGPITAQYKGAARLAEVDEPNRRVVLDASGRDTRGQGNAKATIVVQMAEDGGGTKVDVHTDLQITGKVAQFGRGVLADVSAKLLDQFVADLEKTVLVDEAPAVDEVEPAGAEPVTEPTPVDGDVAAAPSKDAPEKPAVRKIDSPDAQPVDLIETAGTPVAKRVGPILVAIAVLWVLKKLLTRNKG
jgi:uncharacterized protein